ncbi:hypothetical protein HETIRDRAFT_162949 [Heterobasidion irregulare TC 32-1]|uniref:Uncharacterized protein n=1 Tax=Heterobasidion irregulare (strain TC 32-1) TaxID=747525 RepID=W4JRM8_HETIT|nr:uncharacterized protein HETIRDRAFT_162949 [Heterobasidion irregulare TC 32-1]ETW76193.1 hypothetical protein HETIRDRAFT_162949 [Heterobasidion irregulare TC 32-1]
MPNNPIWMAFYLITSKIYANAILTMFNSQMPTRAVDKSNTEISSDIWKYHGNSSHTIEPVTSFTIQP